MSSGLVPKPQFICNIFQVSVSFSLLETKIREGNDTFMQNRLVITLISLLMLQLYGCGGKSKPRAVGQRETPASCLAKEMFYENGTCFPGSGQYGVEPRHFLIPDAPFFNALEKNQISVCFLTETSSDFLYSVQINDYSDT